tara:strand:- start:498 stop:710 length:213 start_codon:yes stop_codon:yes gene_type:complete
MCEGMLISGASKRSTKPIAGDLIYRSQPDLSPTGEEANIIPSQQGGLSYVDTASSSIEMTKFLLHSPRIE